MTPRNAAELALGVAGIYFIVEHVPASVLMLVSALMETDQPGWLRWISCAQVVLMLIFGAALLGSRKRLAARLARGMDAPGSQTAVRGIHAAAISVLGIYFFVPGLSSILSLATLRLSEPRFAGSSNTEFIRFGVQTVLGAGLFLGARGIVRVWAALRTAGRHGVDDAA